MLVYVYSPDTGEFLHQWQCQESPLEPGQYIVPTTGTTIPPIFKEGCATIFQDNKWITVRDCRNQTWYDKDTGEPVVVYTITPAANLVEQVPQHIIDARIQQELIDAATTALHKSDITLLRCIENGVAIPAEWVAYRKSLRDVVSLRSKFIPERPDYPVGS